MSIFSENTVADEILAPKFLFNLPELEKCCNEQQQEELQSFTEDDLFSHSETSFKDKECNNNKLVVDHQSTDQSKLNNLITESFGTSDMKIPNCSQKVNNNSQNLIIELPEESDINLKKSNENDEIKIPKCGQEFSTELGSDKKEIEICDDIIEIPKYCFLNSNEEILKNNDKNYHDDVEVRQQNMLNSRVDAKDSNFEPKLEENPNSFVTENQNNTNLDLNIKMLEEIKVQIEMQFNDSAKIKIINEIIESMKTKIIKDASNTMNDRNGRTPDPKLRSDEQKIVLDIDPNQQNVACEIKNFQNNWSANTSDTTFEIKIEEQTNVITDTDFQDHQKVKDKAIQLYQEPFNHAKSEFEIFKEFENSDLIKNKLVFFCPVCGSEIQPFQGVILNECRHSFCYGCLIDYVKNNGGAGELLCPTNEECDGFVLPQEINSLLSISMKIGNNVNKSTSVSKQEKDTPRKETSIEKKQFTSTLNDENIILEQIIEITNSEQNTNIVIENISPKNKTNYEILMDLEKTSLVPNQFIFDCSLCKNEIEYLNGAVLKECLHCFCFNCLIHYVSNNNNIGCIPCPFEHDDAQCESFLQPEEIKAVQILSIKTAIEPIFEEQQEEGLVQTFLENNILDNKNEQEQETDITQIILDETKIDSINQNEILLKKEQEDITQIVLEDAMLHPTMKNEIIDYNQENQNTKSQCVNPPMYCADYKYLLELEEVDLILTTSKFKCDICLEEIDTGKGVRIKGCLHEFCQQCLIDTINYAEDATSVKCPFFDNDYKCDGTLSQREIKELLSISDFKKYLEKNIKSAELSIKNSFHCLTPNCEYWWIIEGNTSEVLCDVCNVINCINCKNIHSGLSCEQYSDKLLDSNDKAQEQKSAKVISNMLLEKSAMICPNCLNVVEKVIGCDAITCKCKTELCWATKGPRWGPNGVGDTSGGCRCKINGPCTPTCNNCH